MRIDIANVPAVVRSIDLRALAAEINAAHQAGEQATCQGLEHFKRAGEALLKAKAQCGHGKWLKWQKEHITLDRTTAWRYMRIASEWDKCCIVQHLSDALALLTAPEPEEEEQALAVPAGIASLVDAGHISPEHVHVLLGIREDFGDEILYAVRPIGYERIQLRDQEVIAHTWEEWEPDYLQRHPLDSRTAFLTLNALRPLDIPRWWVFPWDWDGSADKAVVKALGTWLEDAYERGCNIPTWEVTAFWFAAQAVRLSGHFPETPLTVEQLAAIVDQWRDTFRSALAWYVTDGFKFSQADRDAAYEAEKETLRATFGDYSDIRWGYWADLRHAGVLAIADEMRDQARARPDLDIDESAHPHLWASFYAGLEMACSEKGYSYPSNMQKHALEYLGKRTGKDVTEVEPDEPAVQPATAILEAGPYAERF
jgi:hypothetical protein